MNKSKLLYIFMIIIDINMCLAENKNTTNVEKANKVYIEFYEKIKPVLELSYNNFDQDEKLLVDMLPKSSYEDINKFIKQNGQISNFTEFWNLNFFDESKFLVSTKPKDFKPMPRYLNNLSPELAKIGQALNDAYLNLSKTQCDSMKIHDSSFLNVKNPIIVPGERFDESYYWDSYWIILGLIKSDMIESAENIIDNFTDLIDQYGFIPNGTRKYYLDRSQPPYYPMMLEALFSAKESNEIDNKWERRINMAIKEYTFFMDLKSVKINNSILNRYNVVTNNPRPESYGIDRRLVEHIENNDDKRTIWRHIKAACESGWDFSSRWLADKNDLATIRTSNNIPVDLNGLMYNNEKILSKLCRFREAQGNEKIAKKFYNFDLNIKDSTFFERSSKNRYEAINKILWNEQEMCWNDVLITKASKSGYYEVIEFTSTGYYFSNITPLFYGINPPNSISAYYILDKFKDDLFGHEGGVPVSSLKNSGTANLQWDFPNAWPPHAEMLSTYLKKNR